MAFINHVDGSSGCRTNSAGVFEKDIREICSSGEGDLPERDCRPIGKLLRQQRYELTQPEDVKTGRLRRDEDSILLRQLVPTLAWRKPSIAGLPGF